MNSENLNLVLQTLYYSFSIILVIVELLKEKKYLNNIKK